MTSTVLDVTVLLLCVSASVVTLGASGDVAPTGPTASDAADRLVTETATVSYRDDAAPNGTRRTHATRAELLALVAVRDADAAFDHRAVETVRDGLGPRTRVDATVVGDDGGTRKTRTPSPTTRGVSLPFRTGDVPAPTRATASVPSRQSGTGATVDRTVTVGPEPPRGATVSAAVVRQPVPDGLVDGSDARPDRGASVRIVVRRW